VAKLLAGFEKQMYLLVKYVLAAELLANLPLGNLARQTVLAPKDTLHLTTSTLSSAEAREITH
jgi:hypothetical protein